MKMDDPAVLDMLRKAKVARIATLSGSGRPAVTPLYFTFVNGHVWLGTAAWTLSARNASANPAVSLLFEVEENPDDRRILRVTGHATVTTDAKAQRTYVWRVAFKYTLTPGGLRNLLAHIRQYRLMDRYHKQSAAKGLPCIIDVVPEAVEWLSDPQPRPQSANQTLI